MVIQEDASIYLAEQRGCSLLDGFRSFHTFNFGSYINEHRCAENELYAFNDDTLIGGAKVSMKVEENMEVFIIPLVGGVEFDNGLGESSFIDSGQAFWFRAAAGESYEIGNPYESDLVNFLQVWFRTNHTDVESPAQVLEFEIHAHRNVLCSLFVERGTGSYIKQEVNGAIGVFDGRKDGVYAVKHSGQDVFVFIVQGVFEVQNRLLHSRDSLLLSNGEEIEFEALSNEAIILVMEF